MTRDMRDLRDPEKLGDAYLEARAAKWPIEAAVTIKVDEYDDSGVISADPEQHHSRTAQDAPHE